MSYWTYVTGVIEVDTYGYTNAHAMYIAQTVLDHLPRVTGSEGPMKTFAFQMPDHNVSWSHDEFGMPSNLGDGYRGRFEAQTIIQITLSGHLRDRMFEETLRETSNFLNRLSKRLGVRDMVVKVSGQDKSFVFTDDNGVYGSMYDVAPDRDSWCDFMYKPYREMSEDYV